MKRRSSVACRDIFRHICENLDENMDSPECREIRKHMDDCPDCVAYLDSLKKTVRLYRVYPSPKVPGTAHRRLIAKLKLPAEKKPRTTKRKA
jgi:hypothetical protein